MLSDSKDSQCPEALAFSLCFSGLLGPALCGWWWWWVRCSVISGSCNPTDCSPSGSLCPWDYVGQLHLLFPSSVLCGLLDNLMPTVVLQFWSPSPPFAVVGSFQHMTVLGISEVLFPCLIGSSLLAWRLYWFFSGAGFAREFQLTDLLLSPNF